MECKYIWAHLDKSVKAVSDALRAKAVTASYADVVSLLDSQKVGWFGLTQKVDIIRAGVKLYLNHGANSQASAKLSALGTLRTYWFNLPGKLGILCQAIDLLN